MADGPDDLRARLAVLEQIAKETHETLAELRTDMRALGGEMRQGFAEMRNLRRDVRSDYRWLQCSAASAPLWNDDFLTDAAMKP